MFVMCCVLRRPDHSFRGFLLGVCVCVSSVGDLETSTMRRPRFKLGCCATEKKPLLECEMSSSSRRTDSVW